jgi:hypothetical protein
MVDSAPPAEPDGGRTRPGLAAAPRAGDLTTGWRLVMIVTWTGVFLAFAGVWKASVEIGIRTWWIGPRSEPRPIVIQVIPFAVAIVVALAATYNVRRLPWTAVAGSLAIGLIALFDVSRSGGLALVEAAIGVGALLVALASFTGRYRAGPPATAGGAAGDGADGGTGNTSGPSGENGDGRRDGGEGWGGSGDGGPSSSRSTDG